VLHICIQDTLIESDQTFQINRLHLIFDDCAGNTLHTGDNAHPVFRMSALVEIFLTNSLIHLEETQEKCIHLHFLRDLRTRYLFPLGKRLPSRLRDPPRRIDVPVAMQ